jgi:hypothetical protein
MCIDAIFLALLLTVPALAQRTQQRVVVLMFDAFGLEYLDQSHMPVLAQWRKRGLFRRVKDRMPSVTNANNASISCGVLPERYGITGNSYFDERAGREEYMETADLLLAPTLLQRAKKQGVNSALLSCKKKTTTLLSPGADLIPSAETPTQASVRRLGPAPDIYSRELLAYGGRNRFAQEPPRSRLPVHPHDRLSDACLAPRDEGVEGTSCSAGPTLWRSGHSGSRRSIPGDCGSRDEPQDAVLGPRESLCLAWHSDSDRDFSRAR